MPTSTRSCLPLTQPPAAHHVPTKQTLVDARWSALPRGSYREPRWPFSLFPKRRTTLRQLRGAFCSREHRISQASVCLLTCKRPRPALELAAVKGLGRDSLEALACAV